MWHDEDAFTTASIVGCNDPRWGGRQDGRYDYRRKRPRLLGALARADDGRPVGRGGRSSSRGETSFTVVDSGLVVRLSAWGGNPAVFSNRAR